VVAATCRAPIVVGLPRNLGGHISLHFKRDHFRLSHRLHNGGPFTVTKDDGFISIGTLRVQVVMHRDLKTERCIEKVRRILLMRKAKV
jgi:hypothetical protein